MWQHNLINAYNSVVDTWDYIWTFAVLINSGLTCTPNVNLIEHIGYGEDSTHIKQPLDFTVLQRHEIEFPLRHPQYIIYDKEADDYTYKKVFFLDRFREVYYKQEEEKLRKKKEKTIDVPGIFQNNGNLKVLFIASKDSGGAGGAARRMHEAVLAAGIDSVMLVLDKQSNAERVAQVEVPINNLDRSKPSAQLFYAFNIIQQRLKDYPQRTNPEMFTTTESIIDYNNLKPYIQEADIINLHWIDGFFDYANASEVFSGKKIIWTLHDMYQFTGGCHYSFGCENYTKNCASCPQLVNNNETTSITQESFNIKAVTYKNLNIQVITPSEWLAECVRKSSLLSACPVEVIPNTFNDNNFKPVDKQIAREKFNLNINKKIILFGADHILSPVKNLQTLLEALSQLCDNKQIDKDDFDLVIFGSGSISVEKIPFNIIQLGRISSVEDMSYIYSCADFLVLPSIMDNLPNIMCEALACGIPVIGFNIGGLPDLIEFGKTGYLAEPFSIEKLKNGIIWGLEEASGNQEISANCCNIVQEKLIQKVILKKMFDLYKKLCPDACIPIEKISKMVSSNDNFRKDFINTIVSLGNNQIIDFVKNNISEIKEWLMLTLLPHANLTEQEIELKQKCLSIIKDKNYSSLEYMRAIVLAIVLVKPEELGKNIVIKNISEEIREIFIFYIFNYKTLPSKNYSINEKLSNIIFYLEQISASNIDLFNDKNILFNVVGSLNKINFYCADGGLKILMQKFAKILKQYLKLNYAKIDYSFPVRKKSNKIKLGIFLSAFGEHTETYATIPAFRHIDKEKFEIYVYVLHDTNSMQQKQYENCIDHFTVLSITNFPQSIDQIRKHNLDILLFGTNVTAVYSPNIIYASHRLARIQAVHFCNPCTTGIKNIDYFITGKILI